MSAADEDVLERSGAADSDVRGKDASFPTTSWTVVRVAGGSDAARARAALSTLAERYRGPVRAYLRHTGYTEAEADALAARFFRELGRTDSLRSAAEAKQPFRAWLLRALAEFVSSDPDPLEPPESDAGAFAPDADAAPLPKVAGYRNLELLGAGGEGLVYRAYDERSQRRVALKVLRPEYRREPEVVDRFRKSTALVSTLEHPNIVRVYDKGGPDDEEPYCAMQLVVGGTLAERQRQEQFRDPQRAARLVIEIARAIHYAHHRGILHRDLSPANILLDVDNVPFVSDFMAKRIQDPGPSTVVGKYAYAAPELAQGKGGTVEADVYALGAILYELWTGRAPIRADSFDEVGRQHEQGKPEPVRSLVPEIPRDLAAVCHAALSRRPEQRHPSAAVLAESLERALVDLPPVWPKLSQRRRFWLWMRRHPLLAVSALLGALMLFAADWLTLASVRTQQAELEAATLHGNAALASAQARAVLALFEKFASEATRAAADPEVRSFVARGEIGAAVPALQRTIERAQSFDSISVFSRDARMIARYPTPSPGILGREFRFREYYQCIDALARRAEQSAGPREQPEVCLSRAYRGEPTGQIVFAFAAPVYSTTGGVIGFVLLNKHAKNTLEQIEIDDVYQSGQTTALFGLRGTDRGSPARAASAPKKLTAVAHPGLFSSEERALAPELSRKLVEHFGEDGAPGLQLRATRARPWEEADYVDPVTGDRRLAGFAPVGATGFVVSVSTPRAKALGASERHIDALWRYAALLNLGFLILAGVAFRASLRDRPPRSAS